MEADAGGGRIVGKGTGAIVVVIVVTFGAVFETDGGTGGCGSTMMVAEGVQGFKGGAARILRGTAGGGSTNGSRGGSVGDTTGSGGIPAGSSSNGSSGGQAGDMTGAGGRSAGGSIKG